MLTVKYQKLIIITMIFYIMIYGKMLYAQTSDYTYLLKPHFDFIDLTETENTHSDNTHNSFKSPRSKTKVLTQFCMLKTKYEKQNYIDTLDNLVKNGKNFQKPINYNAEDERLNKRKDENDATIYRISQEPHTEAAYHLGVIYGFSKCGMQDTPKAIIYLQQAYNKPETYFMTAELYRHDKPNTLQRRIYYLYLNAIHSGIYEAHYNLALYIYQMIDNKNISVSNPENFNFQTIFDNLRKSATHHAIAQNDFAIMLKKTNPNIPRTKLYFLMNVYFKKSAQQGFILAHYNQMIMALSQKCTPEIYRFITKKSTYLKKQKYPLDKKLLLIIKNYKCI